MTMQLATAEIRLDLYNTVTRADLTPAEAIVLQRIHGVDCLSGVVVTGEDAARSGKAEKARLKDRFSNYAGDIETLFPGLSPALPGSFEGIVAEFAETPEVMREARKTRGKPPADPLAVE